VFAVLAAIGLALLAASWRLPETLPAGRRTAEPFGRLAADSRALLADRQFAGNAAAVGLGTAALITYISSLPFIVEDAYGRSPQLFSLVFAINALGLTAAAQAGARLVRRRSAAGLVDASQAAQLLAAIVLRAVALSGRPPLIALLVPLFVLVSAFGMMRPNATALALTGQGAIAGTASAYLGALPFLMGAVLSPLAGLGGRGAAIPAAILMSVLCAGSLGLRLLLTRPSAKPLPTPAAAPGPGPAE